MKQLRNQFRLIFVLSLRNQTSSPYSPRLKIASTSGKELSKKDQDEARREFDEVYNTYSSMIYKALSKEVPPAEVDDLFQEVWIVCHRDLANAKPILNWRTYLHGIAMNKVYGYLRSKYRNTNSIKSLIAFLESNFKINGQRIQNLEDSKKALILQEICDAIENALNKLSPDELRAAWLLKHGFHTPGNISRIAILIDKSEAYIDDKTQTTDKGKGRKFITEDNSAAIMGITKAKYVNLVDKANQRIKTYLYEESWSDPCEEILNG